MIKIGIDKFINDNPTDNCSDFRFEKNDGWNEYPCHTGFVAQWFFNDNDLYQYVSTEEEDSFIYPINFKCFLNAFNITHSECWENDISDLNPKETFLNYIPNHVLDKVRDGNVMILLNYGFEAYDSKDKDTILYLENLLIDKLNEMDIPIKNVFYTDANSSLDKSKIKIKSFSQNYTANCFYINEGEVGSNIDHFTLSDEQIEKKKSSIITKKYLCYNRRPKWHRKTMVDWLKDNEYLEDGYVSFPPNLTLDFEHSPNLVDEVCWAYHEICHKHYDTSFFSIVNESLFGTFDTCTITEKTWKAVFNFHPFVIVGCRGALRYVREKGFDTFDDIFDSAYDDIVDKQKRIEKIFDTISYFLKNNSTSQLNDLRNDIFPRLTHNYKHFWGDFRNHVVDDFHDKIIKNLCTE